MHHAYANEVFFPLQQFWLQLLLYNHLQHSASSFPTCLILKRKWFIIVCVAFVNDFNV